MRLGAYRAVRISEIREANDGGSLKEMANPWDLYPTVDSLGGLGDEALVNQALQSSTKPVQGESKPVASGSTGRVDPVGLYSYLKDKFADSNLIGYVPPDGARWGIKTGSASEWATFGLAVAKQESDLNPKSYNASDPGGSAGLFQFGQGQTRFTGGRDQFDPQASADAFVRSVQHYVGNQGRVANLGATFGSIRRPNEAGQISLMLKGWPLVECLRREALWLRALRLHPLSNKRWPLPLFQHSPLTLLRRSHPRRKPLRKLRRSRRKNRPKLLCWWRLPRLRLELQSCRLPAWFQSRQYPPQPSRSPPPGRGSGYRRSFNDGLE